MYNIKDVLDEDIIIGIKNMLDNNNHYAQKFKIARDKLQSSAALEFLKKGFIYRVGRADISLFYEGPICGMLDYLHISDTNLVVKDVLVNGQWN
ncbi:hypothetical protein JHK82_027524 [Glycine max]|nr:hypothetical protein JHK87_027415 [Glycine soja]KAG5126689.1 hypothetical protein JHK82_027524 [Glycine max]KAG5151304.1 hypothetical protein JHK84_027776 [Glycine max]